VYPVPDTACGLLLLTNDETLVHSFQHQLRSVKQKYEVVLAGIPDTELLTQLENKWKENKALGLTQCKMESDKDGFVLEIEMNGYGIEQIQSDLSEHPYPIVKIDRISLGGMTKKDISRGWYRPLTEKEIIWLKHFH
jgi:23S rRNA pseudouridine2605 synthase